MKQLASRLLLVLAAACTTPAFSASSSALEPDALVILSDRCTVERGMQRSAVEATLGAPSARLATNVWVYWDFHAKNRPAGERFDTLVVVFTEDRVSALKLTDAAPVRAFLARQAAQAQTIARN